VLGVYWSRAQEEGRNSNRSCGETFETKKSPFLEGRRGEGRRERKGRKRKSPKRGTGGEPEKQTADDGNGRQVHRAALKAITRRIQALARITAKRRWDPSGKFNDHQSYKICKSHEKRNRA